jgi:ubiquinone/menaquinone biosynthesis C-methylase UbiE
MSDQDRKEFVEYYAAASLSAETLARYRAIQQLILSRTEPERATRGLDVADVGCGAGTQCFLWAESGHRVHGVDVNAGLIELAKQRAAQKTLPVSFTLGSATKLPWPDQSMDVCIMPQLLEHVAEWQACLDETARILRHGGMLFLSTTNKLCPLQDEFNLPLYSWYPGFVKRRYVELARTTRPDISNYATYPAVNWFTYYGLRSALFERGFDCLDRFDTVDTNGSKMKAAAIGLIRAVPPMRVGAHVLSKYSQVLGIKH